MAGQEFSRDAQLNRPQSQPYAIQRGFEGTAVKKQHSLIFLTGFSGSGKSTIGPLLANSLGYDFLDLDLSIEKNAGKPITRIFADHGEAYFRGLELEALKGIREQSNLVVSLGGGVLDSDLSYEIIKASGTLVYLKSSSKTLARRLYNKSDRPLLKGENEQRLSFEEIEDKINTILSKREARYERAKITVMTDVKRIGSTVEELTRKIERYLRKAAVATTDL